MVISQTDIDQASEDNFGVLTALTAARGSLGDSIIAFFLDQVPERGVNLWERFRTFQREYKEKHKKEVGFIEFIESTIIADPVKLFYPKECTLDEISRGLFVSEIQAAIKGSGIHTNDDVLKIYFAEGVPYTIARNVACRGCPIARCPHYLHFNRQGGQ
ncbi:unnamed protein product [marine sediment metagenome]|uniref:Uncharacterized protein n=1 Tax=marine sediment metagenome TaxID=412755 RepID=X0U1A9_9ZZZZ